MNEGSQRVDSVGPGQRVVDALLRPRSVAILGCSGDLDRVNGRPLRYFLEKGFKGRIYPVNPKHREIAGLASYSDVGAIPGPVDLAVVALPAGAVLGGIRQLLEKKVPAAVIFSSGFAETGPKGAALQRELVVLARAGGLRFTGPNGVGILNAFEGVAATFSEYLEGPTAPGPLAFVSQSGAFGTGIAALARLRGLGMGYYINTGNEADLDFADAIAAVAEDPRIKVIAGYAEGIRDGRRLIAAADRAMELGKTVILTKVGRTESGARAAASHTGALAGSDAVLDGVLRQKGIIRTDDEEQMIDLVEALVHCPLPAGRRLGIVSQSGGAGVLMSDRAEQLGLSVPALSVATQEKLRAVLPSYASVPNPVDVTGQSLAAPEIMQEAMSLVLEDAGVDVGILWLRLMHNHVDAMLSIIGHVKARTMKTFIVSWLAPPECALSELRARGVAVARGSVPAVDAVAGLVRCAEARRHWLASRSEQRSFERPNVQLPRLGGPVASMDGAAILSAAGIQVAPTLLASTADAAVTAAEAVGYPVALKIESRDILHKTEVNGVRLGLADADAVRSAFAEVTRSARAARPQARIAGVLVQKMSAGGTEIVIGAKQDDAFGPVVMVGLGGIFIEVLKDVAFAAAPVNRREAEAMLSSLRGAAVLDGVRGRPPAHRAALQELVVRVSEFVAIAGSRLKELDLNPVIATADGATVVDWVMVLNDEGT